MFGLKGKALLYFVIATALLAGVGVYFFFSTSNLKGRLETQFESKQQTNLLKSLTLDINKLNNQYLNDTLELSDHYIDSIIQNVESNIENIQKENKKLNFKRHESLDSIPEMLYKLKRKNFKLKELRNKGEKDFVLSLEKIVQDEFKDRLLSEKDSVIVTHQITSYIKENKIPVEEPRDKEEQKDDRNFFQRLFNINKKEKSDEKNQPNPIIELDTLTRLQTDTLKPIDTLDSPVDLMEIYERIQLKRIQYVNDVQVVEKEIYELNYGINSRIERIINDFIMQQYTSYEKSARDLKQETSRQSTILYIVIIGFILFTIFLIYRFFKDINRNIFYQDKLKLKEQYATREAEEKQRFLHTMNHEIRTPLTSIIGYVDLLEGDDKNIKAIKSSANYLYHMTNEILDIAKINLGVIDIKKTSINLTQSLNEVKHTFEPELENKGLEYEFNLPEKPIYVKTDGQRIQQILYNLLHNAIKFTEKGFVSLNVEVYEKMDHYFFEFVIEDSGAGMSEIEQIQVFEDFHQAGTHKSKMKGTGLGLGIVRKLVHRLEGEIKVESKENKGSTFTVSFDFPKASTADIKTKEMNRFDAEKLKGLFSEKSILIVDDDTLITNLYRKIIAPTNAKVKTFNNPEIALQNINEQRYDLLIIDYKMPEMSGYDFLIKVKDKLKVMPKTIVATANTFLNEKDKKKLSAFDYIVFKPVKKDGLLNNIAKALGFKPQKITQSQESSQSKQLSFSSLRNYLGNDVNDLIEILEVTTKENDSSLSNLETAIQTENSKEIAFIIHQLSSRFAQIDSSLSKNTKKIEEILNTAQNTFPKDEIQSLYEFWYKGNENIKRELNRLKS